MTIDETAPGSALTAKIVTFLLWALVSLTAVGWGLRFWPLISAQPLSLSAQSVQAGQSQGLNTNTSYSASIGSLLGAEGKSQQKAPDLALARLSLVGVLQTGEGQGVALIAVDSQTPKPYKIGSKVGDSLVLSRVEDKSVYFKTVGDTLGPADTTTNTGLRLDLPRKNAIQQAPPLKSVQPNRDGTLNLPTSGATSVGNGALAESSNMSTNGGNKSGTNSSSTPGFAAQANNSK